MLVIALFIHLTCASVPTPEVKVIVEFGVTVIVPLNELFKHDDPLAVTV